MIACQQGRELAVVASEAGADILNGSSLKAALDIDWDNPEQRQLALEQVLQALEAVESWFAKLQQHDIPQTVNQTLRVARQIEAQDVEVVADGSHQLRRGVAKDRRISIEDPTMRHGRNRGGRFPKSAFVLDWQEQTLTCPNQISVPLQLGKTVYFPASDCAVCPLRERCTTNQRGRSVKIHPDEALLQELRLRQLTPLGRAKNRERTAVEHSLAHLGHWQGRKARYIGLRKNLFDLRRAAVVHNLHVLARGFEQALHQPQTS